MSRTKIPPAVRRDVLDLAMHRKDPKKFQCAGCRRYFPMMAVEIDHVIPEADSTPEQRSDPANLQVLCNPRGSTRNSSCHKAKSAKENRARYKANVGRRNYWPARCWTGLSVTLGAFTWQEVAQQDHEAAVRWAERSAFGTAAVFSTILVYNGFKYRRPRRTVSPQPERQAEPVQEGLSSLRIMSAARDVVGAKGDVSVSLVDQDSFTVSYEETGFADHDDEKRFEMLNKVSAKIGGRWATSWDTVSDRVRFTRRPELARMVRHPGFDSDRPWNVLPIGPGAAFDLLNTPHVLIVGTTGAGKTALMRTLIAAAADSARRDDNVRLILADPKLIEMPGFAGWSGVQEIVGDTEDLWDVGFDLESEMRRRLDLVRSKKAKPSDFKKLIVVIDEYEQYFKRMFRQWTTGVDEDGKPIKKGSGKVPPPVDAIQSVLSMARRVGIHLVIGTQSPDAAWFGGTGTRENMSGRAAVGPVDAYRARMMFDDSSVGRDVPIEFKGRATVQIGDGAPQEVQCYYTPDPFDPDGTNSEEDWETLRLLGMPNMEESH